jgi:hypothetical protein
MRTTILAVIAALAFTGAARADVINTIAVTGWVVGGGDSGPNGTNDDAGLFGGGDLFNAAVTFTVTYDATFVENNFGYYTDGSGYTEAFLDGTLSTPISSPFQMSITIGGIPFNVAGTFADDIQLCPASDSNCGKNSGGIAGEDLAANMLLVYFYNGDSAMAGSDAFNPSDVSAAFGDPNNEYIVVVQNGPERLYDSLNVGSSPASVPEPSTPSTWLVVLTGLGWAATLRHRHRSSLKFL